MSAQLLKILLVEYHFEEAALFEEFLSESRRIRFALRHTQRLEQTLRLLDQESFDAILLDPFLPDSQGLETLADIRSKAPHIPIVVLIGFEDEELGVNAIKSGAADYLFKEQVNSPLLVYALRYAVEHSQMWQKLRESEERYALDIQRQQVEQALERERQQIRAIITHAPVAIAMFDTKMRTLVHSQKWAIDYGLEGKSIIGRTPCQIFSDIPNHWRGLVQRALEGEVLSQPEDKWERVDGSVLYLRWAVQPWFTPEGAIGGVVIVTDRINELVEARVAALDNSRLKSQFLANMSHEIRTPMNGVLGMTQLLAKTDLNPEQKEFVQTLHISAENLLALLNDILDFSKLEANQMRLEMQEFDLNRCVEDVADLFCIAAQSKGIELAVLIDNNVPRQLRGDVHRLRQILMNLVGNAIKFTFTGEVVIQVSLEFETPTYAEIRFSVADTGIGIAPADQKKLFHAFSQVDASTTRLHGGTGLGLAICKQLVEVMGGEIGVASQNAAFVPGRWSAKVASCQRRGKPGEGDQDSTPVQEGEQIITSSLPHPLSASDAKNLQHPKALTSGLAPIPCQKQGSTFWFTMPLAKQVGAIPTLPPVLDLVGLRLLIVSSSASIRKVVETLATFWGMQVEEASNCAEAVTVWHSVKSKNQLIDVAIFDLNLLERESESVREALALRLAQSTKCLLMSSVQERSLALRMMDLGFSGCMTKPLKASKLLGCLRQVLRPLDELQQSHQPSQPDSFEPKPKNPSYRSQVKILLVEDTSTNQKVVLNQLKVLGYEADCAVNGKEALDLLTHRTGFAATGGWGNSEAKESGIREKTSPSDWALRYVHAPQTPCYVLPSCSAKANFLQSVKSQTESCCAITPTNSAYDIVLMDCQMPVIDGYEATRLLRAFEGESCRTVVIAMTANALVGDREKCLAADMDDYISKPVTVEKLEQVLERWVPQRLKEPELPTDCEIALNSQNADSLTSTDYELSTSLKPSQCGNEYLDQVPVDLERLSELTRGDSEFQRELLQVFLEDAVIYLEELKSALAIGDCTTLAHRAHQLKGSSATVAIYKMPEIAAQIEYQAKENQLLGASDLLTELEQILERVQSLIGDGWDC